MPRKIYAVYDNVAGIIIGGLHFHYHDAAAIRMFGDIANLRDSQIALHPADFDLLSLGTLHDDTTIAPKKETILTGANWSAAQQQSAAPDLTLIGEPKDAK